MMEYSQRIMVSDYFSIIMEPIKPYSFIGYELMQTRVSLLTLFYMGGGNIAPPPTYCKFSKNLCGLKARDFVTFNIY